MKRTLLIAFSWIASTAFAGADFVLVDPVNKVRVAPIILYRDAPPYTRQAAEELAAYIEKISGAKPELLVGAPSPLPERAIWVGRHEVLPPQLPKVDFSFQHPEEVLIVATDNHLVIAGRDRWDPDHLVVEGVDEKIVGKQQEYGTVNAIYTFLQDQLGVRWLWPGELGEDVPRRGRIVIGTFEYRHHPQIRARGGAFNFSILSNKGYGRAHDWSRLQRLHLGSLEVGGGHGFGDWWDRFHESQPELFALQPNGKRDGHPSPKNAKLCQSNPAVWQQWLAGVEEQLAKDPTRSTFSGSPNDGWSSGHCVCENCRAWDHPEGEPRLMHWHHFREERPALSDRHVTFANQLGRVLKERFPDKDYRVLMLSYGHSRPAPIEARPADNVIMISVANFYGRTHLVDRGSTWGTTHRDQFKAWGKLAGEVIWRPNTGSPAGWQQGLPDLSVQQTIDDIGFVADNGCIGIYIDGVWEHWATQGPQFYVMAQLLWNPRANADDILNDYYRRGFGPAAESVKHYFKTLEEARMDYVKETTYTGGVAGLPQLFSDELLKRCDELLTLAEKQIEAEAKIFQQRVAFVRAGLSYTALTVENIKAMEGYWEQPDEAIANKVRANWKSIEKIPIDHPYSINWGPVRPFSPRMLGLHPDHPDPKRKAKPKKSQPNDLDQN
jgi:hypothetical protein